MQPNQNQTPVPTSQRPLNGAVLSGTALLAYTVATYYGAPVELAVPAALAVGGTLSTVGDAARGRLEKQPPASFIGELLMKLLARVG